MIQAKYLKLRNNKKNCKNSSFWKKKICRIFKLIFLTIELISFIFLGLSLIFYNSEDSSWTKITFNSEIHNLVGHIGSVVADIFFQIFGFTAFILVVLCLYLFVIKLKSFFFHHHNKPLKNSWFRSFFGCFFIIISSSVLLNIVCPKNHDLPFLFGGIIGDIFSYTMLQIFSKAQLKMVMSIFLLIGTLFFFGQYFLKINILLFRIFLNGGLFIIKYCKKIFFLLITNKNKIIEEPQKNILDDVVFQTKKSLFSDRSNKSIFIDKKSDLGTKQKISKNYEQQHNIDANSNYLKETPPLSLLDDYENVSIICYTQEELEKISYLVEDKLNDFGIQAQVVAVHPGPVVTRFELQLAAGTKVSRITSLSKDLARSLSVISVRIVEIIPGKSVIGIELPNVKREVVRLKSILSSQQYIRSSAILALVLGKDISGSPVVVDLAKMPHLLVAGTTGAGKSVCLNAILLSLLYKYQAQELKLILIDPKMLELSIYEGIPHLLVPVVTNMKEAANALRWCIGEMERRYKLMMALGVRNISGYNEKIKEAKKNGNPLVDYSSQKITGEKNELNTLPYLVIIADEYADMVMVVGKKVEELIARIAQKARASGIHLILATQRPSVDVVTGLIKANIPTRIAFQVSSKIDSRTILDQSGAEQLLGSGDMLYLAPGSGIPIRIHGAFVADNEVHRVVNYLKKQGPPQYVNEILFGTGANNCESAATNDVDQFCTMSYTDQDIEFDVLYNQVVNFVTETRKASTSSIQRYFKIGYNRAARIMDAMEHAGIVGPMQSNGNRVILNNKSNDEKN